MDTDSNQPPSSAVPRRSTTGDSPHEPPVRPWELELLISGAVTFALLQLPDELPGWKASASVAALAIGGTALAQIVVFRMLRHHGAARLSLVTYLLPVTAVAYGALLLDERLTAGTLAGLALILPGVALGSGAIRLPRREPAAATPRA